MNLVARARRRTDESERSLSARRAGALRVAACGLALVALLGVGAVFGCAQDSRAQTPIRVASRPRLAASGAGALRRAARNTAADRVRALLAGIKEVSYNPSANGWTYMWTRWHPRAIDSDMARLAHLGANTVRICICPFTFGWPEPSAPMLTELRWFISDAAQHGLRVHLTLFDWWGNYTDPPVRSETWASGILQAVVPTHRLAVIELQNEIDPTNAAAMAWAGVMLPFLRTQADGVPVTISEYNSHEPGVAGIKALKAALGTSQPDFYDYHFYLYPGAAHSIISQVQRAVAPTPLFIGEYGQSSLSDQGAPSGDALQDLTIRTVALAVRSLGLPDPGLWTLNDFAPGAIPPGTTAINPSQYQFGIFTVADRAKPAAESISALFHTGIVSADFNSDFASSYRSTASPTGLMPIDWEPFDPSQGTFAFDPHGGQDGGGAVRISHSTGSSLQTPAFHLVPPDAWVTAGHRYTLSAWARGQNATGVIGVAIAFFDNNGDYLGGQQSASLPTGTTGWMRLSVTALAPAGASYVALHLKSAFNTGAVWFDDVSWPS